MRIVSRGDTLLRCAARRLTWSGSRAGTSPACASWGNVGTMRWIVGIDLRERSYGALAFVSWAQPLLRDHQFIAAHTALLSAFPGSPPLDSASLQVGTLQHLHRELGQVASSFTEVGVIDAIAPEDGLTEAMRLNEATGLIVGRRANMHDDAWIRLGRVTRRLLRSLPGPVITIPADLKASDIGTGPVLLTTDLSPTSVGALHFANAFAAALGRPLHIVHAVQRGQRVVPPADVWTTGPEQPAPQVGSPATWLASHGVPEATTSIENGHILDVLRQRMHTQRPCLVVCGSRSLTLVDRIFTSSIGSTLAAHAPVPVAVVPANWTPAQ